MDISDTTSELPDESEVVQSPEEPEPSHLLSPSTEETPSSGDTAPREDDAAGGLLRETEPSLESSSDSLEPAAEMADTIPPGDDIEFPSSRNSPDIPGASSVMISCWDPRGSPPQSPRSEHSSQSSFYPSGSARTSIAGGAEPPRSLVRSRDPKADLSSGDVVMLMHQGRPYVAIQARLPYKDDAWHTVLELAEDGAAPESEALSYLEVVKQGPFVGFRSGAAGNRFMQPRRKAPHRLVFFNQNCGVWEQWDVLGEDWRVAPWSTLPLVLRSRRLPQVQVAVDMVRVGYFTSPGLAGLPPSRALLPVIPEETHLEDRNLRRISNLLVAEWFKFVDHEKLLREGLEEDLASLADESQELKLKTIQQVEYLRMHMNEEMASLSHHVALRDDAISTLRRWLRRAQQLAADRMARQRHRRILMAWRIVVDDIVFHKTAILKLRRKREDTLRESAFRAWNLHTRAVLGAAVKLRFAVQRRSHSLMSRVLKGWQLAVAHRGWRGRTMLAAVQRRAARRMAASFASWRRLVAQRALARRSLLRALHGVNQSCLAAALMAWRAATQAVHQKAVQAELLVARRAARLQAAALDAWRDQVVRGRQADRHARALLLRKALTGWRQSATAAHSRQAAVEALVTARLGALRREALVAWHVATTTAVALRVRLGRHVMSRSAALQGRALAGWSLAARERRRRRVVLQRHLKALGMRKAALALAGWRALAARAAWRRVRVLAALGRAANRRMSAALVSWHSHAAASRAIAGRAALVASRLRRMRLVACLGAWHHLAARFGAARTNLLALCRRLLSCTLSGAFREWRLMTATAAASRSAVARTLPSRTRELLTAVLATWWTRHCAFAPGEDSGLASTRSAAAAASSNDVSGGGGSSSPLAATVSGLSTGYAAAAAAAAAATTTEPLGYVTASPRQSLVQLYDTTVPTGATAPSRSGAVVSHELSTVSVTSIDSQLTAPEASELSAAASTWLPPHPQLSSWVSGPPGIAASSAAGAVVTASAWIFDAVLSPVGSPQGRASVDPSSAPSTAPRPPTHPPSPTVSLGLTLPIFTMPSQRRPRGSSSSSTGGAAAAAAAAIAAASSATVPPLDLSAEFPSLTTYTPPARTGRTYREALVAGAAAAAAAASRAAADRRSSSTGRLRGSASGLTGGGASGAAGPFLPANAAVIGSGSSSVLLEMGPTRGCEGPLTPVGLPELLDGPLMMMARELSRESSFAAGFGLLEAVAAAGSEEAEGEVATVPDGSVEAAALAQETLRQVHASLQQQAAAGLAAAFPAVTTEEEEAGTPTASRSLGFAAGEADPHHPHQQQLRSVGLPASASAPAMATAASAVARSLHASVAGRRVAQATARSGLGRWLAAAVLSRWRRAVASQQRWVASLEGMAAARRRQLAGAVLEAWWQAAAASRAVLVAAEVLAGKSRARRGRQAAREALVLWHAVARRGAVVRVLLTRQSGRVCAATARRVMTEWHNVAAGRAAAERKVERQAIRRAQALLTVVLRAWRDEAAAGAARCVAASELATSRARGLLVCALQGWSDAAVNRRERAARQARAARHATRRRLVGAFRGWRWAAEEASEREVAAVRASRTTVLRTAFGGWWRMTAAASQVGVVVLSASLHRATCWHERRLMRGCLAALGEHKEQQLELQRLAAALSDRSRRAAVLAAWRREAEWARWGATEAARMRSRSGQRLQSRCLSSWMGLTESSAAARLAAGKMAVRLQRSRLGEVLAGWQAVASDAVAARVRQAACVRRIARGCLQRAFLAWHEATVQGRASRVRQLVVRRRLEMQRLRRLLADWAALAADLRSLRAEADRRFAASSTALRSLALAGWIDLTQRLRAARAASATRGSVADLALLRHALGCWSAAVERSRDAVAAADAMAARRAAAVLPAVLRGWAAVACEDEARRLQLAALRNLMLRRRTAFARRTFGAWRDAVFERQSRDDELRRCIKRKKLAFSLFKQWYWEAFDSDVQATIWRMFHSTDPAAHSPEPSSRAPAPGQRLPLPALQQPLPAYLLQHQQYVNRRTAAGVSYGGNSATRDLPPLDLEHEMGAVDSGATTSDYRPRLLTAPDRTTAHQAHQAHPVRSSRAATAGSYPLVQSRLHTASQAHPPPPQGPEPVRTLASTFDAVAQQSTATTAAASGSRPRAMSMAVTPSLAAMAGAGRGVVAAAGRRDSALAGAPRPAAYPVLRPSDSESSEEHEDLRGLAAAGTASRPVAAAAAAAGTAQRRRDTGVAAPTSSSTSRGARSGRAEAPSGGAAAARRPVAATGAAASMSSAKTALSGRTSVTTATTASRRASSSSASARRPTTTRAAASASLPVAAVATRASGDATAVAAAAAAAAAAATAPSLEAMSAALNVAIRSLDLAAGVVNSGAAAAAAGGTGLGIELGNTPSAAIALSHRPSRVTISSVGSAAGPSTYATRISADGSAAAGAAAGSSAVPLSPLSPPSRGPFHTAYGNAPDSGGSAAPGSAGAGLPGVVPTWRKVANNQLYSCDEEWYGEYYGDELGPVDPLYVGIAGAGASIGVGGVAADGRARMDDGDEPADDEGAADMASRLEAALSIRTMLLQQAAGLGGGADGVAAAGYAGSIGGGGISEGGGTANTSALGSRRASSDAGSGASYFPRHSIFRNAVFQRQAEARDEEEEDDDDEGGNRDRLDEGVEEGVEEVDEMEEGGMAAFGFGFGGVGGDGYAAEEQEVASEQDGEEEEA